MNREPGALGQFPNNLTESLVDERATSLQVRGWPAAERYSRGTQGSKRGKNVRRKALKVLAAAGGIMLLSAPLGAAVKHGEQVTDARYSIRFLLPVAWKDAAVTTATTGSTKVLVQDISGTAAVAVVQVQVVDGRNTNAAEIATGLVQSAPTAKILGSAVKSFRFGKAEELRFSLTNSGIVVYGIADAFYLHNKTYIVAFDSARSGMNSAAQNSVLGSWGT
jgi:hypothetical protein